MMGIGPFEILLLLAVLLIVLGPERMPDVVRIVARVLRELRSAAMDVRQQVEDMADLQEMRDQVDAVRDTVNAADVRPDLRLMDSTETEGAPEAASPSPEPAPGAPAPAPSSEVESPAHPE